MQTLRNAAGLLAAATSLDSVAPITRALGFDEPATLDADSRRRLGLGDDVADARVANGPGALRALVVELTPASDTRDLLPRLAARLATRTPHVLWLLAAVQPSAGLVALAAWAGNRRPPRVSALIVDTHRVVDSDAESLRALIAARGELDLLTHTRWVDVFGRDALTRRFYRTLERVVRDIAASARIANDRARSEIALLYVSRLLFLAFLEAKGWLDGDHAFLANRFDACMTRGGDFHRRVLLPLFFGTLNTPPAHRADIARRFGRVPFLNGGLFSRTPIERTARGLAFSDEAYGALLHDLFAQYRFTAREETSSLSEAAIDPEMLGKAFESLMVARERRTTGAYFTPHHLVDRVVTRGLEQLLGDAADDRRGMLERITVLDPACGSGAFLVHVLERLAALLHHAGDDRPIDAIRRDVLTRSIFGVDRNPTAVWLCELRLWLSVVIESQPADPSSVSPLPNLDHNIRVGDALAGSAFTDATPRGGAELTRMRQRYARSTGSRKDALGRQLAAAERRTALAAIDAELATVIQRRRDLVVVRRGRDLFGGRHVATREERAAASDLRRRAADLRATRRRLGAGGALPFSFAAHFADVGARGGFDLVVGNPPWVRLHHLEPSARETYRRDFQVARFAAWEAGAGSAGAGHGFAAQIDLAALFVERSLRLLARDAVLALLVPVKLWRSLAGGGMRRLLQTDGTLRHLEDYSEAPSAFDAAVYPSLIVAARGHSGDACVTAALHHRGQPVAEWRAPVGAIPFDASSGAPWIVLPPDVRRAFDAMRRVGTPLAESVIGRPLLGVKCGCNDAFVVDVIASDGTLSHVVDRHGRHGTIECELLRPVMRGESVSAWRVSHDAAHILWTHGPAGGPLPTLPPHAARWLAKWRRDLVARTDARRATRWWTLFRTESARCDRPRVIWADMGRAPRAALLPAGCATVGLNSCYVARCRDDGDALTLAALLNGPLAAAWLNALAEPARGGYRRYLGWTMALLPLPADWDRARAALVPFAERAIGDASAVTTRALFDAAVDAYGLTHDDVAPLVAWLAR